MSIADELKKRAAELAAHRVSNFEPFIGGSFQCPQCWIESGRRLRIVAVPDQKSEVLTTYHCFACDLKIAG
jgi:hypothetical protein